MFYLATQHGFVTDDDMLCASIRLARSFDTFSQANEFAKDPENAWIGHYYAILTSTIPEAA